jgi:hypothetical protein
MKQIIFLWMAVFPLAVSSARAQVYSQQTIRATGGGGTSQGGGFKITGSIGQPIVGIRTGAVFQVSSGFWVPTAAPTLDSSCLVLICPTNVTTKCASASGAVVDYSVTARNGCNPNDFVLTCVPPSGSLFSIGTNLVNCGKLLGDRKRNDQPMFFPRDC